MLLPAPFRVSRKRAMLLAALLIIAGLYVQPASAQIARRHHFDAAPAEICQTQPPPSGKSFLFEGFDAAADPTLGSASRAASIPRYEPISFDLARAPIDFTVGNNPLGASPEEPSAESPGALNLPRLSLDLSRYQEPADRALRPPDGSSQAPQAMILAQKPEHFHWGPALGESLVFLGMMHGKRLTEYKTRSKLGGHWWQNYVQTVTHVNRWYDGRPDNPDPPMTEYFNHGVMGAISGYIFVQNDPKSRDLFYGNNRAYWFSRFKVFIWAGLYNAQWKLGPISEASLGHPKVGYVTFVSTPVIGTFWVFGEDLIERYVVLKVERKTQRRVWRGFARGLTPTRSAANVMRFKKFWYRPTRPLGAPYESFHLPY